MIDETIEIALVVAAGENNVIGKDGGLPWHVSSDLKFFRKITLGKPVIMGRKTFQSIGKPLGGRPHIVVTRDPDFVADGIFVAPDLDVAVDMARELAADLGQDEVMVIGGGQVYQATLPRADRVYLTRIHANPDGDAHFPSLSDDGWSCVSEERHEPGPRDDYGFSLMVYERGGAS